MESVAKERNLKLKNGLWVCDIAVGGRRVRQVVGTSKAQARDALTKIRSRLLDEKNELRKRAGKDERIAFAKFADEFMKTYSKPNKKSWRRDEVSLVHLKDHFKGQTLQDIMAEEVERYKAKRRDEAASPATVNRELACLKTLLTKAVEWGKIDRNPAARVRKFPERNIRERILTRDEIQLLLAAAAPHLRPILVVALGTGMRRGEILCLRWRSVDFSHGFILVEDSKSGKSRKVPVSSLVRESLKAMKPEGEFVFMNPNTRTHVQDVKAAFRGACQRAALKGVTFHSLRHTAASAMIEAGVDVVTVGRILGHSSIVMTQRYCHPTPENMKLAVEKLADAVGPSQLVTKDVMERETGIQTGTPSYVEN
jgi:integrase